MKIQHDGDCTIYASLDNIGKPEAGICTCGYGLEQMRTGNFSELYSKELEEKLRRDNPNPMSDTAFDRIIEDATKEGGLTDKLSGEEK